MISPLNLVKAIPTPYAVIALAFLVLAAFGAGFVKGVQSEGDRHAEHLAQIAAEQAKLAAKNAERIRLAEAATKDTADGWMAATEYWRSNPRIVRVRDANCSSFEMPAFPVSTSGLNAANGIAALSATGITAAECETQLNMGYRDASRAEFLMDWFRKQQEASK